MAALPGMIARNYGRIVMMSASDEVLSTLPAGAALGLRMSKSATFTLTRTLTAETEDKDIHINAVCPGYLTSGKHTVSPWTFSSIIDCLIDVYR
jgi:NAD(P)-dependent dehydrogenase (short-subunit alcohol dehydrogenase family)